MTTWLMRSNWLRCARTIEMLSLILRSFIVRATSNFTAQVHGIAICHFDQRCDRAREADLRGTPRGVKLQAIGERLSNSTITPSVDRLREVRASPVIAIGRRLADRIPPKKRVEAPGPSPVLKNR
ncbi:hypothetical protein LXA43DRAFT_405822 [Ganoderma leucocontextum]|nr:hypothetical protein LXA43DRAFT_405822 [Ganoderma leucocontextum]